MALERFTLLDSSSSSIGSPRFGRGSVPDLFMVRTESDYVSDSSLCSIYRVVVVSLIGPSRCFILIACA